MCVKGDKQCICLHIHKLFLKSGVYKELVCTRPGKGLFTLYILCVLLNYESYDYLTLVFKKKNLNVNSL